MDDNLQSENTEPIEEQAVVEQDDVEQDEPRLAPEPESEPVEPDESVAPVEPYRSPISRVQGSIVEGLSQLRRTTSRKSTQDLFEVPHEEDNDIATEDLFALDTEDIMGGDEDMSDLTSVSTDDIMGKPITSRKKRRMRTQPRYEPPPTGIGGIRVQ